MCFTRFPIPVCLGTRLIEIGQEWENGGLLCITTVDLPFILLCLLAAASICRYLWIMILSFYI